MSRNGRLAFAATAAVSYTHLAIAANRFGLGARPQELTAIGGDGRDWLRAQLTATPLLADAALRSSAEILAQGLVLQRQIQAARRLSLIHI